MMISVLKFCLSIVLVLSGAIIINNIIKYKEKISKIKIIIYSVFFGLLTILLHDQTYNFVVPIILYLSCVVIYSSIFNLSISKSFIVSGIMFITLFLSDFVCSLFLFMFFSSDTIRSYPVVMTFANILISCVACLISSNYKYKDFFRNLINRVNLNNEKSMLFFVTISIFVLSFSYLSLVNGSNISEKLVDIIIIVLIFSLVICFIVEQNKYNKLNSEYEAIYRYIMTVEEWLDNEHLSYHEYKNQLVFIREIIKEKEAIDYIDSILGESIDFDNNLDYQIRNVPTGGMKGLIFYKIMQANKLGIRVNIDISSTIKKIDFNNDINKTKRICRIMGIIIDNAIEASVLCLNGELFIEQYVLDDKIFFVVSNTYVEDVDIKRMQSGGFTTKGKGHGNGLNYAKNFMKKNQWISLTTLVTNNYFIQKIIINNNKKPL